MARRKSTKLTVPAITPELKQAVKTLLLAEAHVAVIRPAIDEIDRQVLANYVLHYDAKWFDSARIDPEWVAERDANGRRITDIDDTFMGDSDELGGYYAARDAAIAAAGYTVRAPGNCPACEAETDVTIAKRTVIEQSIYLTAGRLPEGKQITAHSLLCAGLKVYNGWVENTVKLVLSMCPEITAQQLLSEVESHA